MQYSVEYSSLHYALHSHVVTCEPKPRSFHLLKADE